MAITSLYATSGELGVALGAIFTPPTSAVYSIGDQPPFALGTRVTATDGSVWVYVVLGTGGVTNTGYSCVFDENWLAVMLSTSTDTYGTPVGVPACGAAVIGDYCWLQIAGTCAAIRVAALAAENVALFATATAGEVDDGGSTSPYVQNMVLTTTAVGASTVEGQLNFPQIANYATPA